MVKWKSFCSILSVQNKKKWKRTPQTSSLMKLTGFYNLSYKTSGQKRNGGAVTDPEWRGGWHRHRGDMDEREQANPGPRGTRCYRKCGWRTGRKKERWVENLCIKAVRSLQFLLSQMRHLFGETAPERLRTLDTRHSKVRREAWD